MTYDTTRSADLEQDMGRPDVEVAGPRFRVWTAKFATPWLPDTPSTRHLTVVWLRVLVDEHGKPLFTWHE